MGIEKLFSTIINNKILSNNILIDNYKADYVYIDFSCLVYNEIDIIDYELNFILYEIILNKEYSEEAKLYIDKYNRILNKSGCPTNIEEFKKEYNTSFIYEKIIISKIEELVEQSSKLFIAFEGLPTMTKIIEQRKRKYNNYVSEQINKVFYTKYKDDFDEYRKIYEANKIRVERKKDINDILQHITNKYNIQISVSYENENGEGEKKIIDEIHNTYMYNKKEGKYIIYSTDADVIILSLILVNNYNLDIKVIRGKETIDIPKLRENIIEYVNKNDIINDICFLINFIGNDFIPKLVCLSNKNNLLTILDTYKEYLINNNNIVYKEDIFKINYNNLINYLKILNNYENKLLYERYAQNNYKNTSYIKLILELDTKANNFYDRLNNYITGYNKFVNNKFRIINNYGETPFPNNLLKKQILIFENKDMYNDIIKETDEEINNKFKIYLNKYHKNNLYFRNTYTQYNEEFDKEYIELEHPLMSITNLDRELYKFNNRLDNYRNLHTTDELGWINIEHYKGKYYISKDDNIENNKKKYYENFKIEDVNNLCNEYISGIFWIFDYYFNKKTNTNKISTWCYSYNTVPFVSDLINYISNVINLNVLFNKMSDITSTNYIESNLFMTDIEYEIFISPPNNIINYIPERYKRVFNNNKIFPDLSKIILDILNLNSSEIYSEKSYYYYKTILKNIEIITYDEFMNLVLYLRN